MTMTAACRGIGDPLMAPPPPHSLGPWRGARSGGGSPEGHGEGAGVEEALRRGEGGRRPQQDGEAEPAHQEERLVEEAVRWGEGGGQAEGGGEAGAAGQDGLLEEA